MNKTLERLYLTLYWRQKAYGYPPSLNELAEMANVSQTMIMQRLKELATQGYIKLFLYDNGDYNVKFIIEPKREWVVNIRYRNGEIDSITSEIPIKVYVWDKYIEPRIYQSRKTLDKAELIKKGIMV
ncbi:MAG: hypothetical protein MJ197_09930 [Bacteroidales bacterium]|nr:hypothetical protein [Bacteroidales bacterium]